VAVKEIGNKWIFGFPDEIRMESVVARRRIFGAGRKTVAVKNRLQLFIYKTRPCQFDRLELKRHSNVDVRFKVRLPERSQLPTAARQVLQNASTCQPMKDMSDRRSADTVLFSSRFLTQQYGHTLQAELHEIIGNNLRPIRWLGRRRCRWTCRSARWNRQSSIIRLREILLFNQFADSGSNWRCTYTIPLGKGIKCKSLRTDLTGPNVRNEVLFDESRNGHAKLAGGLFGSLLCEEGSVQERTRLILVLAIYLDIGAIVKYFGNNITSCVFRQVLMG
jgi:hypothetical protein